MLSHSFQCADFKLWSITYCLTDVLTLYHIAVLYTCTPHTPKDTKHMSLTSYELIIVAKQLTTSYSKAKVDEQAVTDKPNKSNS